MTYRLNRRNGLGHLAKEQHEPSISGRQGKMKRKLSQEEIDKIVVAQADDDSVWEKPIYVRREQSGSFSIPAELAARVAFLARLHRQANIEEWITHIIQERVEIEEAAFVRAKCELATKNGG